MSSGAKMDPLREERRKRHELSYGVYNFRDVKLHFSKLGWKFKRGPQLSYDHFYVKPGKDPRNKAHKQGEDYFLGEAELVAYARKLKIFGDDTVPVDGQPPPANGKRRARSSSSARTSQATVDVSSGDSDRGRKRRKREHKRRRRRSSENKVGNSVHNPIALSSDSSGDETGSEDAAVAVDSASSVEEEEWTVEDTRGGFDEDDDEYEEEDDDDEEKEEGEDSSSSSSEEKEEKEEGEHSSSSLTTENNTHDEPEDEDFEPAVNAKRSVKRLAGESRPYTQTQDVKRKETGKTNGVVVNAKAKRKRQPEREHREADDDDGADDEPSHKSPRPLLKTSHRGRFMQTAKRQHKTQSRSHSGNSSKNLAGSGKHGGKKRAQSKHKILRTIIGRKSKSAPRSLLENANTAHDGGWEDDDDNGFDLGVDLYGESPPRRPPSRVHSRANSVKSGPSSPSTSITASPPWDLSEEQKEDPPPAQCTQEKSNTLPASAPSAPTGAAPSSSTVPTTPHSSLSSSTNTPVVSVPTPPPDPNSRSDVPAQVSMELTQVVLPPDLDNKYHVRVTESADKPPVHTIWMENLSSHEQREYSFTDVMDLPAAKTDVRVPTESVLKALYRCLSSQPDAVVIVGPEPKSTAESKPASEKGEILLRTSTAEKQPGDTEDSGDGLTLIVAYPALDFFRVDHRFPMKLIPTDERLLHLAKEVERLREQLALVQTDRDKLCDQLRQQEEENERTLSRQVEAQVQARLAAQEQQSEQDIERRVADLVEERSETLKQALEKEKRDRSRAVRWVFACSDWMAAFQPCRALIAGATAETETSILRPATAASPRKYVVEWKELVEIAEPFFQSTKSDVGLTQAITVVQDGVYQVNASVCHDSLVRLRLVIRPARSGETTEIAPTTVLLYDNKRRVSRVDKMFYLRALDQLSLELELLNSTTSAQHEEWLLTPMPTQNRLLVTILDEHATHMYRRERGEADK
ncbi:hypothetical protein PF010_g11540 [Phytophthora fragariae]|uniref:Uncharacterized protein n=2 Tax=Phytophthora fragariae TaxID=53985 RepID=A0A6G0L5D9_9STRA|nr:hypothetical protein PF010_g11540 [Phytophthora fragariae]